MAKITIKKPLWINEEELKKVREETRRKNAEFFRLLEEAREATKKSTLHLG